MFLLIGSPEKENDINPRWRRATGKSNGRIEQQGPQLLKHQASFDPVQPHRLSPPGQRWENFNWVWKNTFVYGSLKYYAVCQLPVAAEVASLANSR